MHRHQHHMLLGVQPQQRCPEQRTALKVERPFRLVLHQAPQRGLPLRRIPQRRQVGHSKLERPRRLNHLHAHAVHCCNPRPQNLVTADQLLKRPLQRFRRQRADKPEGSCYCVGRPNSLKLLQKP